MNSIHRLSSALLSGSLALGCHPKEESKSELLPQAMTVQEARETIAHTVKGLIETGKFLSVDCKKMSNQSNDEDLKYVSLQRRNQEPQCVELVWNLDTLKQARIMFWSENSGAGLATGFDAFLIYKDKKADDGTLFYEFKGFEQEVQAHMACWDEKLSAGQKCRKDIADKMHYEPLGKN